MPNVIYKIRKFMKVLGVKINNVSVINNHKSNVYILDYDDYIFRVEESHGVVNKIVLEGQNLDNLFI